MRGGPGHPDRTRRTLRKGTTPGLDEVLGLRLRLKGRVGKRAPFLPLRTGVRHDSGLERHPCPKQNSITETGFATEQWELTGETYE